MFYVYHASAGSGKTHLLTGFYINLLLRKDWAAEGMDRTALFNEILAVTFTNKATAEMKTRIIEELKTLSNNPVQSDYYTDLTQNGHLSEREIQQKSRNILCHILNDYSDFNISTIDSFFQKIVRSFARELNLQGNFEIELDADRILDIAVNSFISNLDLNDDSQVFDWLLNFSRDRIDEGNGWDFKQELLKMSHVLISEEYKYYSEEIARFTQNKDALKQYTVEMKRIVRNFKTELKDIGIQGLLEIKNLDLKITDFYNGSRSPMQIFNVWKNGTDKYPTETFFKWATNLDVWFSKKSDYYGVFSEEELSNLQSIMEKAIDLFGAPYIYHLSAQEILKNIYQLGILSNIDRQAKQYCADQCIMLLSNSTQLLNELIKDTYDAPFIYEKVGTRINHFMIDEFQDTSGMQWGNFRPLLSNSLGEGHRNLIVGDIKQSIYRWRGSDWRLMHSELNKFEPEQRAQNPNELDTNWRSDTNIIEFNNKFFSEAANTLDIAYNEGLATPNHDIREIYHDVAQLISPRKKKADTGLLHIEFLNGEKSADQINDAMKRLPELIIKLQQNGYQAKDIAILGRSNDICTLSAETLLAYKREHPECEYIMDIISSEALKLNQRLSIQTLISLMQYLQKPESDILRAIAAANYLQLGGCSTDEALLQYFKEKTIHPKLSEIAHRPLYEMAEELIAILPAEGRKDEAFLQAFRDIVLEFVSGKSADLSSFLEWWDICGYKKAIATPEEQNAIRILTIHKAKGLGMPVVIIPFASWDMDINSRGDILWCKPQDEQFAREDLVLPLRCSSTLAKTIFHKEFNDERRRVLIDNLNTAYVAFTRAEEAMIIMTPKVKENKNAKANLKLERLLDDYLKHNGDYDNGLWERLAERREKSLASVSSKISDSSVSSDISVSSESETKMPNSANSLNDEAFVGNLSLPRLSLRKSQMLADGEKRQRGQCIHEALAAIKYKDDAADAIARLYHNGTLNENIISQDEMSAIVENIMSHNEVNQWFAKNLIVLNEQSILSDGDETKRPDRIVIDPQGTVTIIDYKTGQERKSYAKQVRKYAKLLKSIGYENVNGYLWYLDPFTIEQVC